MAHQNGAMEIKLFTNVNLKDIKLAFSQHLASQMVTALVVLDQNLAIQYLNSAAEAMFSRSLNRLHNQPFLEIFNHCSITPERLRQIITTGQDFTDSEVVLEFIENQHKTLEVTASVMFYNDEKHVLLECTQIDKQKEISAEVFQEQQWEAARDLIKGLAHEIKNPLGGLRGAAQLLHRELNNDQQEFTTMIIEQADRLTNLVDRLLGPNQMPVLEMHNIHEVMEKVFQLVSMDNEKGIKLIRDYDPSIPDMEIDTEKLQQTLLNIIRNATQVLDENGQITLKTRIATNQTINGEHVRLAVKLSIIDNGPGIPPHIQDTIFYPMVSGRADGTGLGLSIAQTLIHQHQGKLSCHSYPGHTQFNILLPLPKRNLP